MTDPIRSAITNTSYPLFDLEDPLRPESPYAGEVMVLDAKTRQPIGEVVQANRKNARLTIIARDLRGKPVTNTVTGHPHKFVTWRPFVIVHVPTGREWPSAEKPS